MFNTTEVQLRKMVFSYNIITFHEAKTCGAQERLSANKNGSESTVVKTVELT
jgi:hypothetical protein